MRLRRTSDQLRELVQNNLATLRARSGDGLLQKLRTRNPDQSFNKSEKRWYSWMRDKCRTPTEKADMEELNALVNYSHMRWKICAGHMKRTVGEAMEEAVGEAPCAEVVMFAALQRHRTSLAVASQGVQADTVDRKPRVIKQALESMHSVLSWCRGCEIDGVHVECSFSTRVPGGKVCTRGSPSASCLFCSEARLKTLDTLDERRLAKGASVLQRGRFAQIARSFKAYCAWRKEHPAVYDAAMDRIARWVPDLKNHFEREAAKDKVEHKPLARLEERAVTDQQQHEEQWASAKASWSGTSAPSSFVRKRKCQDAAPAKVAKQSPWSSLNKKGSAMRSIPSGYYYERGYPSSRVVAKAKVKRVAVAK